MTTLATQPAAMPPNSAPSSTDLAGSLCFDWVPSLVAAALYIVITAFLVLAGYRLAGRHFVYPLDDTYIGMAMAKNLTLHGVWGITRYGFTSSDSSILLPLLLAAGDRLFGTPQILPLLLCWLAGLASIFVAGRIVAGFLQRSGQLATLLAFVLLAQLFVTGVLGMEHSFHVVFTLLFLACFLESGAATPTRGSLGTLAIVTALMVASRYEALFFVAPAFCVLALQRRWKPAFVLLLAAAVPVLGYAAFSIAHSGYWLPNSVALKGIQLHNKTLPQPFYDVLRTLRENYLDAGLQLFLLVPATGFAALATGRTSARHAIPLLIVFLAGVQHLCLARIGTLFRYEDYWVAAAVLTLACAWPVLKSSGEQLLRSGILVLLCAAGLVLSVRAIAVSIALPICSRAVYLQQWQMARFLHQNFPHAIVAANDVGAIDYFNDIRCFDLVGLANGDVFRARRQGAYTTDFLRAKTDAAHVQIAILYDSWFPMPPPGLYGGPALPAGWVRVARWTIADRAILGSRTVSFYAVDPAFAMPLRSALARFDPSLPDGVMATMDPEAPAARRSGSTSDSGAGGGG